MFQPHGKHLIAGEWVQGENTFLSDPAHGPAHAFSVGTTAMVDDAAQAAEAAFWSFGYLSREERAVFLDTIAQEIENRGDAITEIATSETGLPAARIEGERGRTVGQLRLFAAHIRKGDYLGLRVDPAMPERKPAPRPEIRMIERPIGPVAVFGASNFPLAFSTAGGDTAAALAAGCPVIVKGHSAHPGTGEIVAEAISVAIDICGLHPGVFSLIQGGDRKVGAALVTHPLVKAVGFTGSLAGGRALFDLCAQRDEPIPFYGELGSVNPIFLLPQALAARSSSLGRDWAASLTMGVGQFCTNPGIAVVPAGADGDAFVEAARAALCEVAPQTMLTEGIASAYRKGDAHIGQTPQVRALVQGESTGRDAAPNLYEVEANVFTRTPALAEEVFGPLGLVVRVPGAEAMKDIAQGFGGQLTVTLHLDDGDTALAQDLLPVLERKAGRILVNGFPTGVEVVDSMVHGGPYPASTNFGATSVGTLSIRRFLRAVAYQNLPQNLLQPDLS